MEIYTSIYFVELQCDDVLPDSISSKGCEHVPGRANFDFLVSVTTKCPNHEIFTGSKKLDGICRSLQFADAISFPNYLGHRNLNEAIRSISSYKMFIKQGCSNHFEEFVCALHFLKCNDKKPPCRRICELSRNSCAPKLMELGLKWPRFLSCGRFPDSDYADVCIGGTKKSNK